MTIVFEKSDTRKTCGKMGNLGDPSCSSLQVLSNKGPNFGSSGAAEDTRNSRGSKTSWIEDDDDLSILNSEVAIGDLESHDLVFSYIELQYGFTLRPCSAHSEYVFTQKAKRQYSTMLVYMSKAFGHNVPPEFKESVESEAAAVEAKLRDAQRLYVPRVFKHTPSGDTKQQFSSEHLHEDVLPLTVYSTNYSGEINSKPIQKKRKCCGVGFSHVLDYLQVLSFAWWRQRNPFGKMFFGLSSAAAFCSLLCLFIVQFRDWKLKDVGQVHFFVFFYTLYLGYCTLHFAVFNLHFSKDRSLWLNQLLYLYSQQWEHFLQDRAEERRQKEEQKAERQSRIARAMGGFSGTTTNPGSNANGDSSKPANSLASGTGNASARGLTSSFQDPSYDEAAVDAEQREATVPSSRPMTMTPGGGSYGAVEDSPATAAKKQSRLGCMNMGVGGDQNQAMNESTAIIADSIPLQSGSTTFNYAMPSGPEQILSARGSLISNGGLNSARGAASMLAVQKQKRDGGANAAQEQMNNTFAPPASKVYGTYRGPFTTTVGSLPQGEQTWLQQHLWSSPEIQRQNWDQVQSLRRSPFCWFMLVFYAFLINASMFSIGFAHWTDPGVLRGPLATGWTVVPETDGFDPTKEQGKVTAEESAAQAKFETAVRQHLGWSEGKGSFRFCKETKQYLPDNAHYCSYDNFVVLGRDHHCPWVGNCIGFGNYKFFVLFLFWYWLQAIVGFLLNLRAVGFYLMSDLCGDTLFRQRGTQLTQFVSEQYQIVAAAQGRDPVANAQQEWEYCRVFLVLTVKRNRYTDELDWSDGPLANAGQVDSSRSECKQVTSESDEELLAETTGVEDGVGTGGSPRAQKNKKSGLLSRRVAVPEIRNLQDSQKVSDLSLKTRRYNRSFIKRKYGWNVVRFYLSGIFFNLSDVRIYTLWMGMVWYGFCVGFVFLVGEHQLAQFTEGKMLGSWDKYAPPEHNTLYQNTCRWLGPNPLLWLLPIPGTGNRHNGLYEPGPEMYDGR
eukprot:g9495.t1